MKLQLNFQIVRFLNYKQRFSDSLPRIGNLLQGFAFDYWKERRKSMREVPSSRLNFLRRR